MATLTHVCKKCKALEKRSVSHIDPKLYKDPNKALVKLGYWCKGCGTNIGLEYKCLADGTVQALKEFDPAPQLGKFRIDPVYAEEEEDSLEIEDTTPILKPEDIVVEVTD